MLLALIYTCIIEAAVTLVICLCLRYDRSRTGKLAFYNLLCNLFTNPLLNMGLFLAFYLGAGPGLILFLTIVGEICVVAAEYGLYRLMSDEKRSICLLISVLTNAISYLSGLLIM